MSSVRFENVSKVFDKLVAVRNLNFEIAEGEFVVFVGPSGCGKTTTLRMLAGLQTPSYGRIWIGDRDVTLDSPGKHDISMVFQSYALFPHRTVYKNLAFGPECEGCREANSTKRSERCRRSSISTSCSIGILMNCPGANDNGLRSGGR